MSDLEKRLKDSLVGETFTGFVLLRGKELKSRKDGGLFLRLEIGDRSGRMFANVWDDAGTLFDDFIVGDVLKVRGIIEQYRDNRTLTIRQIRKARPEDECREADLVPSVETDVSLMISHLNRIIANVKNPYLRTLLEAFFTDETFLSAFSRAPAGKLWHHNRLGGLLEHTLPLARLCRYLGRMYPGIDRDLLIAGALLHDIGKVEELSRDLIFDYTDRGRLVGHITLGAQMVANRALKIENFPPELLDNIQHLILSHQGTPEQGSPMEPKTREAFLLHFADEIDSKMDAYKRLMEEKLPGERWKFVSLLGRHLDLGDTRDEVEE